MQRLLALLAGFTQRRPGRVLALIGAFTVVFAVIASDQATDTELTAFAPDSEVADALERVQEEFGAGASTLQVVVDAGDGDVLSPAGLRAGRAARDEILAADLELDLGLGLGDTPEALRSFAGAIDQTLVAMDVDPVAATEAEIGAAASEAIAGGAGALISLDADPEAGTAQGGLVVLTFPNSMDLDEVGRISLRLADRIERIDVEEIGATGISLSPLNGAVIGSSVEKQSEEEMPRLLALSLLLIVLILLVQYRTISDVVIGFIGLIATVIWMFGISVLLGPAYLGLTGPFTQISLIVPVLLVGLGIDYAIHLTSRYREEQAHAQPPGAAAAMAVRSVGGALVLATITTIVGFLTNLASPLPPIGDFGVFTAVGVASAFLIMTALVPSARNLIDTRRSRRPALLRRRRPRPTRPHRPANGLARLIGRTSIIAERIPTVALGIAIVISVAGAVAATQVETTFSQEDLIPPDSPTGLLIDRVDELFSGDIEESTHVLFDGDLTDPAVRAELDALPERLAVVPAVRVDEGLARTDLILAPDQRSGLVSIATAASGPERATSLAKDLELLLEPFDDLGVATTVTSEDLVIGEAVDALTASQTRGIIITLIAALILLVSYYGITARTPMLGVITMIPSIAVVTWVLGTMWLLGITFNVLTAMVASLGIGIGVPFGIHITHRFGEDRRRYDTVDEAIRMTVTHTGGAMAGSAATTATGFGVLMLASLLPIQTFGMIVAITIIYSFLAAVLIQPACLKLWADRRVRRGEIVELYEHERRGPTEQAS